MITAPGQVWGLCIESPTKLAIYRFGTGTIYEIRQKVKVTSTNGGFQYTHLAEFAAY